MTFSRSSASASGCADPGAGQGPPDPGARRSVTTPIAALLAALYVAAPAGGASQDFPDAFERGAQARERGDWRAALEIWEAAADSLYLDDRADPRIGIAYLETIVERRERDRLSRASEIFLGSFTGRDADRSRETLAEEARRIVPLLPEHEAARWEELIAGPAEALARAIRRYWIENDPTPDTPLNERLVEHWERVVYARRNYTYDRSSPYGSDARGTIHVRYGPPHTKTAGFLGANEMELKIRVPQDGVAREELRRLDPNPQFELWKYAGLNPADYTFFLFGNERGTGPFRLVDGPLDLIGDAARSLASASKTPGGVRAQHYLELFYYGDLAVLGGHYGKRFDELAQLWDGYTERETAAGFNLGPSPSGATLETFSYRFAEEDRYAPPGAPAVPSISELDEAAREVEVILQPVRILDDENRPAIVLQVLSSERIRVTEGRPSRAFQAPSTDVEHTLILRDGDLEEAGRTSRIAPASEGGISVFRLLHPARPVHLTVLGRPVDPPRDDTLQLPGQAHAWFDAPLSSDPGSFEISDLAYGTALENLERGLSYPLPFPLLPAERLWRGDELRVYLELYHLSVPPGEAGRYALSFTLAALDERGQPRSSPAPVRLGIEVESPEPTAKRSYDLDLTGFAPGRYRLTVEATDLRSGATKGRSADVEIIG